MSSKEPKKSKDGVSKRSDTTVKAPDSHSRIQQMEEMASNGSLSQKKIDAAQVSISQDGEAEQSPYTDSRTQDQSKPPYDSQEGSSGSQGQTLVESIEPNDTEMKDVISEPGTEAKPGSARQGLPSTTGHPQRLDDISSNTSSDNGFDDPECLADLGSLFDDGDGDHIVDGWGTLRRSTFVILQYGPRHGAKYKAKYKTGYNTSGMNNIQIVLNEFLCSKTMMVEGEKLGDTRNTMLPEFTVLLPKKERTQLNHTSLTSVFGSRSSGKI